MKPLDAVNAAYPHLKALRQFLPPAQHAFVKQCLSGEENEYFVAKLAELAHTVENMPATYAQESLGDQAVAYLHYFHGGSDWWITEKDCDKDGEGQIQAFGLASLHGDTPELGYISIAELLQCGVELDFHFQPKTIHQIQTGEKPPEPPPSSPPPAPPQNPTPPEPTPNISAGANDAPDLADFATWKKSKADRTPKTPLLDPPAKSISKPKSAMKQRFNPLSDSAPAVVNPSAPIPCGRAKTKIPNPKSPIQNPKRKSPRRSSTDDPQTALARAQGGLSLANYPTIIEGFMARGIPADQILPRENVFTFNAWLAKGRRVRKGEKSLSILTWRHAGGKETVDPSTGALTVTEGRKFPWTAHVFHITQTDPLIAAPAAPSHAPIHPQPENLKPDNVKPSPLPTHVIGSWRTRLRA